MTFIYSVHFNCNDYGFKWVIMRILKKTKTDYYKRPKAVSDTNKGKRKITLFIWSSRDSNPCYHDKGSGEVVILSWHGRADVGRCGHWYQADVEVSAFIHLFSTCGSFSEWGWLCVVSWVNDDPSETEGHKIKEKINTGGSWKVRVSCLTTKGKSVSEETEKRKTVKHRLQS